MVSPAAVVPVKIIAFLQRLLFEAVLFPFNYSMPSGRPAPPVHNRPIYGILRQVWWPAETGNPLRGPLEGVLRKRAWTMLAADKPSRDGDGGIVLANPGIDGAGWDS